MNTPAPFDTVAVDYDAVFTDTPLGRRQREIVHRRLRTIIRPGMTVLELNCGTGEDAVWMARNGALVTATDLSEGMLEVATRKASRLEPNQRITFRRMSLEEFLAGTTPDLGRFDRILSNFDGLNCIPDLSPMSEALVKHLNPDGEAVLVFMNPICLMEILSMTVRGKWHNALQRLRRDGLPVHIGNDIFLRTYFHPVGRAIRTFRRSFVLQRVEAVGLTTPPTLMRGFYERHQRLFNAFHGLEDLLSSLPPFNRIGDHVLIHIRLRGGNNVKTRDTDQEQSTIS